MTSDECWCLMIEVLIVFNGDDFKGEVDLMERCNMSCEQHRVCLSLWIQCVCVWGCVCV